MSAYDPFTGTFVAVVGVEGGVEPALGVATVESSFGFGKGAGLSPESFGALRGGAAGRRFTVLVNPGVGFGLASFSGCFTGSSSAFRFVPFSGEGTAANRGRDPGLLTSAGGR